METAPKKWGCLEGINVIGRVAKVYDGDTLHVHAPVGEAGGIYDVKCRLAGIDAPELKVNKSAKETLIALVEETKGKVFCNFGPNDKYGRPLVKLYGDPTKPSLNQRMIDLKQAKEYHGGKRDTAV